MELFAIIEITSIEDDEVSGMNCIGVFKSEKEAYAYKSHNYNPPYWHVLRIDLGDMSVYRS